ncbi:MAG: symmetrical bis(5'-nucleosyl)-tetraphosphatase [Candidatus Polarisedimenticolaceae bacterium]|nr:symmetrical bis(5'-nucleosyl)-tetraphosphatase [Candidatus Polarisedimenticolaceae bacterium]
MDKLKFDPVKDRLWIAGDMVNRGPHSLKVVRYLMALGSRAICVLGNHDLHLLALSEGNIKHNRDTGLYDILNAPDRDELLHWIRHRPLMHHSEKRGYSLIHAGLPPQWDIPTALSLAHEVEAVLQGDGYHAFCHDMYGDKPDIWSEGLHGMGRLRFIVNCFTRMRFCDREGRLALREKGPPTSPYNTDLLPWYKIPGRASADDRILFGHWSTLGYYNNHNVWALDSGCLWGNKLTAVKVRKRKKPIPIHQNCNGALQPSVRR